MKENKYHNNLWSIKASVHVYSIEGVIGVVVLQNKLNCQKSKFLSKSKDLVLSRAKIIYYYHVDMRSNITERCHRFSNFIVVKSSFILFFVRLKLLSDNIYTVYSKDKGIKIFGQKLANVDKNGFDWNRKGIILKKILHVGTELWMFCDTWIKVSVTSDGCKWDIKIDI